MIGFYRLKDVWRDGRVAEGGGLLNRYRVKSSIEGSNPSLSAIPRAFVTSLSEPTDNLGR